MSISKLYAKKIAAREFGQAPKKKLSRSTLEKLIQVAWVSGACSELSRVLNKDAEQDQSSYEELLGDLQIAFTEIGREFTRITLQPFTISVEEVMNIKEYKNGK